MSIILDRDHDAPDAHPGDAPVDLSPDDHLTNAIPLLPVVGSSSEGPAVENSPPAHSTPNPQNFAELRLLAESFEDAQKARIAIENRLRSGADSGPVADALDALRHAETRLSLAMRRSFRKAAPDVAAWVKATPGVGEHLVARLLGVIGHPVIASPYHWEGEGSERVLVADPLFVRNVAKLWAYCGHGDPSRKRRKGMSAEEGAALGNPRAKMLVHLLAESCIKCVGSPAIDQSASHRSAPGADTDFSGDHLTLDARVIAVSAECSTDDGAAVTSKPIGLAPRRRSPYRDIYDLARIAYADREDWTDGHRHNAALRLVGKAILVDLYRAAA